jgi:hypothetical protein
VVGPPSFDPDPQAIQLEDHMPRAPICPRRRGPSKGRFQMGCSVDAIFDSDALVNGITTVHVGGIR